MNRAFLDYYRCPESSVRFSLQSIDQDADVAGYFAFGPDLVCYGRSKSGTSSSSDDVLHDAMPQVAVDGATLRLPFDPDEVAENLRYERYVTAPDVAGWKGLVRKAYYAMRPIFPVSFRRHLQRRWLQGWDRIPFPHWPVDRTVDKMFERLMLLTLRAHPEAKIPFIWFWPEGHSSCAIMTHDVETAAGLAFAPTLMDINDSFGIKSSFQVIPGARYEATAAELAEIRRRGFEVNVHDFKHDGHLYDDRAEFEKLAVKINDSAVRFQARGFRAGVLYRKQEWYSAFKFSYDMSVPNVGHLDPQKGGCCTVMPYFVGEILEIPVTTIQDYSLFNIIEAFSLDLWTRQIDCIRSQHGLINVIVHPDYLDSAAARTVYQGLLAMLANHRAKDGVWIPLPAEVDIWWRQRHKMSLVSSDSGLRIEGDGRERARIAYATLKDGEVVYEISEACETVA